MRKICAITLLLCGNLVHAQGQYICAGQIATIVASNPSNLSNPSYSLNPGGIISSNGVFTVQPAVSTNYTVYVSGMMGSFFATTTNTVQINVSQAPTFSLVSPSNYTLGCSSTSFAVVNITNAQTTPTPGGILSGTALAQGQQLPPSGPLGNAFSFTLTSSGTYTAVVRDNSTGCDTHIPFSIIANTLLPVLDSVKVPRSILDCATSSVELTTYGGSNTSFSWRAPGNISQAGQTFTVYSIPAQPTQTLVGTFTAVVTDNNNLCGTQSVVTIYQNLFKPNALITPASASLTCQTPSVILTNASSTGIPPNGPFTYSAPVI